MEGEGVERGADTKRGWEGMKGVWTVPTDVFKENESRREPTPSPSLFTGAAETFEVRKDDDDNLG